METKVTSLNKFEKYIVDCRGATQLRGPDPWYDRVDPSKLGAGKSFLLTESSLVIKMKNTWLILLSH